MEGFEGGWPAFFEVLRVYLARFAGMKAASFLVLATSENPQAEVWKNLTEALGLAATYVGEEQGHASSSQRDCPASSNACGRTTSSAPSCCV